MKILRFDIDGHKIITYLYVDGTLKWHDIAETMAKLSIKENALSDLSGVYVYRGPGGYSKLRSIWAFAMGLSLGGIPVQGYKEWSDKLSQLIPRNTNQSIIYSQEIK